VRRPNPNAIDELAREMYSAALVVEGFSEQTADSMSERGYPEHYYRTASDLLDIQLEEDAGGAS